MLKKILIAILVLTLVLQNISFVGASAESLTDRLPDSSYGAEITQSYSHDKDGASIRLCADKASVSYQLDEGKVCEVWFFDNIENMSINTAALVSVNSTSIGIYGQISENKYVVKNSSDDLWEITDITRSGGWHQLIFDYSGSIQKLYIDGVLVRNYNGGNKKMQTLRFSDTWENSNISGMCIDDVSVCDSFDDVEQAASKTVADISTESTELLSGAVMLKVGKNTAYVKNYKHTLDSPPLISGDRTFIPLRFLSEGFGSKVSYDSYANSATVTAGGKIITVTPGEEYMRVNGEKVLLDAPVMINNGRMMIPLRAFSLSIGKEVFWDDSGLIVVYPKETVLDSTDSKLINELTKMFDNDETNGVMTSLYVSPDGSDENGEGSLENPWQTIDYAREKVRGIILSGMTGNIEVNLMGGTYLQENSITFTEKDSGTGHYKVIYKNYDENMPLIFGGKAVAGWEKYKGNIYKTKVSSESFNLITENGRQAIKARYPNNEYLLAIADTPSSKTSFYAPQDAGIPALSSLDGLELYAWSGDAIAWFSDTKKIVSYSPNTGYIKVDSNTRYNMGNGARFYLQGALEFLDSPGEFYLDEKNGELYYYPYGDINTAEVVVANTANIVEFLGSDYDNSVKNIELRGIEFNTADRDCSGIYMQNARNIEITGCKIMNVGKHGVFLNGSVNSCIVKNCDISYIGYNGFFARNLPENSTEVSSFKSHTKYNELINCHIYEGGKLVGDGCGAQLYDSEGNTVMNCRVHDFPRYGLSIKGAKKPNVLKTSTVEGVEINEGNYREIQHSQDNIIMYNDVYNVNTDSQDTGIFETWCSDKGNVIANNHFHDSGVNFSISTGIYLDDAADGFLKMYR